MQTASGNIGAYQTTKQAEVGIAGAEALGKMGAAGGANANLGGGGMNMAGMMAGMAMGGAVGQNMACMFNNMNQGLNNNQQIQSPPPIPSNIFHMVYADGKTGQFDLNGMKNNISQGILTKDTLVWKQGMANWQKASEVPEINSLFSVAGGMTPPPIPQ